MKVLLINPNYHPDSPTANIDPVPPLGIMYIASLLENYGFYVKIIDAFFEKLSERELSSKILDFSPDIIGITADSINFFDSLKVAKISKTILKLIIVMGGPHATLRSKEVIKYPEVDIVVIGEGEFTMLDICNRIKKGVSLIGCEGTLIKENGEIILNPSRGRIKNLDLLPYPARHLVRFEEYQRDYLFGESSILKIPVDLINSSRGCPYNCSFCSSREIWNHGYKIRSPKIVVDEMEFLVKKYNTKTIYFREDNFTADRERVLGICDEIRNRNFQIDWVCSSRVDQIDERLLKKMSEAGCKAIQFGMESGCQKTLKILNKRITVEEIRKAVKITKNIGITPGGTFMIGIPGETLEDINLTTDFIKELKLKKTTIFPFMAIPNSRLYHKTKREKLYDSSYGEMLNVVTEEFDRDILEKIINLTMKNLRNIWRIDNLKKNPIKYLLKYGIKAIIHPKLFIRSIKKNKID